VNGELMSMSQSDRAVVASGSVGALVVVARVNVPIRPGRVWRRLGSMSQSDPAEGSCRYPNSTGQL